jgi:quinol monooxygenase YgiN
LAAIAAAAAQHIITRVSVAGCLGYDVLANCGNYRTRTLKVSVAGCLGYELKEL